MQIGSSSVWSRITVSISYDDNRYTLNATTFHDQTTSVLVYRLNCNSIRTYVYVYTYVSMGVCVGGVVEFKIAQEESD